MTDLDLKMKNLTLHTFLDASGVKIKKSQLLRYYEDLTQLQIEDYYHYVFVYS